MNTVHLLCWDYQSSPAFNETMSDIDVPEEVLNKAVENFGNFLSKEMSEEVVEMATPEDLARLETDGKRTNNVLLSGISLKQTAT